MSTADLTLELEILAAGLPGVTRAVGAFMVEAASVCLDSQGHRAGVFLMVDGNKECKFRLQFTAIEQATIASWKDEEVCTEYGAYCIALLLATKLTPHTVLERARKGQGFDYWLGSERKGLFNNKARLEVSGIRKGDDSAIRSRFSIKKEQVKPSDGIAPAFICIVEFGNPKSIFEKKSE
jgi:hypothetical protein